MKCLSWKFKNMAAPIALFALTALLSTGCTDPVASVQNNNGSQQDVGNSTDTDDASPGTCEIACNQDQFCDETTGTCRAKVCEPGALQCQRDNLMRCNAAGSKFEVEETCRPNGCTDNSHCLDACENGTLCGSANELCCEGETPVCNARGLCAPDCGQDRVLCGANADICCGSGELCIFEQCRPIGKECTRFTDCDFGEYCEAGIGHCLSDDFPAGIECREEVEFDDLEIQLKWANDAYEIISLPVVGDVTGDGIPNIVINAAGPSSNNNWPKGNIVILDGRTGAEIRRIPHDPDNNQYGSHARSNIALADVDGDGKLDIIYPSHLESTSGNRSHIVAINGDGETLWVAKDKLGEKVKITVDNGAISVARFDNDPRAKIIVGASLIHHDGTVLWNHNNNGGQVGSNGTYYGGVGVVADLDGDGKPEIVTGRQAWKVNWQQAAAPNELPEVNVELYWEHGVAADDGYVAVADMDADGTPEVILVSNSQLRILEGTTGKLWCGRDSSGLECAANDSLRTQSVILPGGQSGSNRGGPPTIADFDKDGRPEIGVAGGYFYTVFDINRPGEAIEHPADEPAPEPGQIFVRWKQATQDKSSNATGSSVFDFQGDGAAEVVYADECHMRVYSGDDGQILYEIENSTGTILEYPLVVDVDGNGRSEILVVANTINVGANCKMDGYSPRKGIYAYEDPNDKWVRTRAIWNQHAYNINNINDDGTLPFPVRPWWHEHNTFRSNRQGEVPLNAPNPTVAALSATTFTCPPLMTIRATISNPGTRAIPAGMPVSLYRKYGTTLEIVAIQATTAILLPGAELVLEFPYEADASEYNDPLDFRVIANDDGTGTPVEFDCNPSSASRDIDGLVCRITG